MGLGRELTRGLEALGNLPHQLVSRDVGQNAEDHDRPHEAG